MKLGATHRALVGLIVCAAVFADAGAVLIGRHGQDNHALLFGVRQTTVGLGLVGLGIGTAVVLAIVWLQYQRTETAHDRIHRHPRR